MMAGAASRDASGGVPHIAIGPQAVSHNSHGVRERLLWLRITHMADASISHASQHLLRRGVLCADRCNELYSSLPPAI